MKTLQDRPRLLPPRRTTVRFLTRLPAPSDLPETRLPVERRVYTVQAAVVLVRRELDGDLHLVLAEHYRSMIAEAPAVSCTTHATRLRRRQMAVARRAVRVCAQAVVTGVLFFDFPHGQTGLAPNAVELHPVLSFRCVRQR